MKIDLKSLLPFVPSHMKPVATAVLELAEKAEDRQERIEASLVTLASVIQRQAYQIDQLTQALAPSKKAVH